ncbi:bifunctional ADP-dependent NAD(P)H-hydrate dehydratase/NAD(P)H-hydrate epimerase [Halomonas halocynthiae]|uniref:bifunctional ADP-dependent NAD(P)H-hydrate dehydratase/NAD(P)H-hydrate epimerase n=1 Tax=Halomonas halocynthiae TaxID=176290 RepID=UPI0003F50C89|nr:bifunctional ADP-dependent NAD(P)H-hydrate dehydratase/NAD(P)H-hydrate epimerase [Halomonas halocynthiae]
MTQVSDGEELAISGRALYCAEQVREMDRRIIASGITGFALMQRAAAAAWQQLKQSWPDVRSISVLCGGGNNGGDGHVLAALAAAEGVTVQRILLTPLARLRDDALRAADMATAAGVGSEDWCAELAFSGEVLVDAMLGTGLTGPVRGDVAEAINAVNRSECPILAIDIPSGLAADTGAELGVAVCATLTVTFIGNKLGLHTGKGPARTGTLHFYPLGADAELVTDMPPSARQLSSALIDATLAPRERDAHKGQMGHVLIIGGAPGFGGAALLAAEACARLGAGRISLATAPEHVTASLVRCPEVMVHGVTTPASIESLMAQVDAVVIGPGLGQGSWGQAMLQRVLAFSGPLVLDADGLNLLAGRFADVSRANWILTPHPGEAAHLLGMSVAEVEADRPKAALLLRERYQAVVVLKGAGSLIAGPAGLAVCPYGNPGMASGGMGDVLSGMLGTLVCQTPGLELAAQIAVMVHAQAADYAASQAGERGLLASDLAFCARTLVNPILRMTAGTTTGTQDDAAATR